MGNNQDQAAAHKKQRIHRKQLGPSQQALSSHLAFPQ